MAQSEIKKRKVDEDLPYDTVICISLAENDEVERGKDLALTIVDYFESEIEEREEEVEDMPDEEFYALEIFNFLKHCLQRNVFTKLVLKTVTEELAEQDQNYARHIKYIRAVYAFLFTSY